MAYGAGKDWDVCYVCKHNCPKPALPDSKECTADRSCFKWNERIPSVRGVGDLVYTTPRV